MYILNALSVQEESVHVCIFLHSQLGVLPTWQGGGGNHSSSSGGGGGGEGEEGEGGGGRGGEERGGRERPPVCNTSVMESVLQ